MLVQQTSSSYHFKLTCTPRDIAEKLPSWCQTRITHSPYKNIYCSTLPILLLEIRPNKGLQATKYAKEMNSSKLYKMILQNKFFEKCFTLCWKMIVQNPRMILVEGPSRGKTYDRNILREFTRNGSKVVFTVWSALYLHEDGPLLATGAVKVE